MQDTNKLFEDIAESLPQIVWTALPDGTVTYYNQRWREFTGFPQSEGLGSGWKVVLHPEDEERTIKAWHRSVETGEPYEIEHRVITNGGKYKWVLSKGLPVRNEKGEITRWYGSATDISKLKETEDELRITTEKNKLLMKEIVHRTKNTLQLVDSLINLQISHHNNEISEILKNTQSRIRSIAILHQKLNESNSIDQIDTRIYFEELISIILRIFSHNKEQITININVDSIKVPVNFAVNLGLITNELITNALKYAFPDGRKGNVDLSLSRGDTGELRLEIRDNGIGIQNDSGRSNSLGLQIVYSLVDQNKGKILQNSSSGTYYLINFPPENYNGID
jgi:PAS domain S-box-containing protein